MCIFYKHFDLLTNIKNKYFFPKVKYIYWHISQIYSFINLSKQVIFADKC